MLPEAGAFELVFLAMVALIVVGPKDLPVLLRKVGQFTAKMRGLAAEFRASFDEMARQSELDDLRKEVEALRTGQFAAQHVPEVEGHLREIDSSIRSEPTLPLPSPSAAARLSDDVEAEPLLPFDGPAGDETDRSEALAHETRA